MTVLEFYGCAMLAFGPALSMFWLTVAKDPIKVIVFITAAFCWLVSFLAVAICWAIIKPFGQYLIISAILSVISQEFFRYLFHSLVKRAQLALGKMINGDPSASDEHHNVQNPPQAAQQQEVTVDNNSKEFGYRLSLSYVSGLGYGVMSGAFALMNVLSDSLGPGTIGLKGDSQYFLIISSMTTLAFILLNVCWSVMMAGGIEKSNKNLLRMVVVAHLIATISTFLNKMGLQIFSLIIVYSITVVCGLLAFQVAGLNMKSFRA